MNLRLALVIAILLAGAPAQAKTVNASGTCTEAASGTLVDATAAHSMVPSRFALLEAGGKAVLSFFAGQCSTRVGKGKKGRSIFSGAFFILDPRDENGCSSYDLFWTNNKKDAWYSSMRSIGWPIGLAPKSTFTSAAAPGTGVNYDSNIPYKPAPLTLTLTTNSPASQPEPLDEVHCAASHGRIVKASFHHEPVDLGAGVGRATFGESKTWKSLGASSSALPMIVERFTWTASIEAVK